MKNIYCTACMLNCAIILVSTITFGFCYPKMYTVHYVSLCFYSPYSRFPMRFIKYWTKLNQITGKAVQWQSEHNMAKLLLQIAENQIYWKHIALTRLYLYLGMKLNIAQICYILQSWESIHFYSSVKMFVYCKRMPLISQTHNFQDL